MKHATSETLDKIESLLESVRNINGLKEKKAGIFYYKSSAFLHFHEQGNRFFADVKLTPPDFERLPVTTKPQQRKLIKMIQEFVK